MKRERERREEHDYGGEKGGMCVSGREEGQKCVGVTKIDTF